MKKLLEKYDIELSEQEIKKFEKFLTIFKEKNSQINLSAIRDDEAIIEKHFIDSIILNVFFEFLKTPSLTPPLPGEGDLRVADMGTGGGFPLIPLAIINSKVQFIGIDSVGKKLKAVDNFVLELGLKNVDTINSRAEDLGRDLKYRESFDYITSRATAFFPTLLEYVIPLLKVGGIFIAYKLDDKEELKSTKKALIKLGSKIIKVKSYNVADQKRTIVFIEKVKITHKKYPRRVGEPLKNPL